MGQNGRQMGQLEHAGRGGAAPYRTPAALSAEGSVNQATRPGVVLLGTGGLRATGWVLPPSTQSTGRLDPLHEERRRLLWITRRETFKARR